EELSTTVIPAKFELSQNYPNPFNPATTIRFSLPQAGEVKLTVYNLLGQVVTTLVNGYREAGTYNVNWDASNLSTGVYIYRVEANSFSLTKKMTLLK
ncbi:MAG: T9SS type A sorting domain-containing protein, partial [Ignavibacteria bacterium]|nr:T9SS type A sorting domain-containing protein [Ignavibacteria bacterium]